MNYEEKLIAIVSEILDVPPEILSLETRRDQIADFDSLSVVMVIAEMCDAFGVTISDSRIGTTKLETVGDFLKLIQ